MAISGEVAVLPPKLPLSLVAVSGEVTHINTLSVSNRVTIQVRRKASLWQIRNKICRQINRHMVDTLVEKLLPPTRIASRQASTVSTTRFALPVSRSAISRYSVSRTSDKLYTKV